LQLVDFTQNKNSVFCFHTTSANCGITAMLKSTPAYLDGTFRKVDKSVFAAGYRWKLHRTWAL